MVDDVTGKGQGGRLPYRYSDPFQTFRSEMDRLAGSSLGGTPAIGALRHALPAGEALTPTLDVKETEKELVVKAGLPGIDEKDIRRNRGTAAGGNARRFYAAPRRKTLIS